MENELICLDSSVLIEYYRKKDKTKSFIFELSQKYDRFAVSTITEYEIYIGSNFAQDKFWDEFFQNVMTLPYTSEVNKQAIIIDRKLKKISKQIDTPDLMIAASSMTHGLKLATMNTKHFDRIEGLELVTKK